MTLLFWLIAGTMVLVALLIVLLPLLRTRGDAIADDLDQRNIRIARERLAELKANRASGGLSQTQFDEQVAELELALSDDLELPDSSKKPYSQGRWLAYVLIVAIPVLSASLYGTLGDYQAIGRSNEPDPASSAAPSPEAINQMVAGLAEKLKSDPNNLEGWLLLGRSYKVLERYPDAVEAFAHAYRLAGDKVEVMLPYAEALALSKDSNWAGQPYELITKAMAIEPENLTGIWFAAIANAQQGDKQSAVGFLRKLETLLPADSPDKQQVHELIANTEGRLANPASTATASDQPAAPPGVAVDIQVSLATELQSSVNPEDTVFIYAQALSGPKMPLAIVRKRVSELPVSVRLSDAESMLPNMKLSNFKQVRLLARISKSGSAMPQAGDLIGTVEEANLAGHHGHKIVINDRIK